MSLAQFLADYGYFAVFMGCFFEGETILVMAGFAAHHGHLSLPVVLAVAFCAGTLGDQVFFWVGRIWWPALLARYPALGPRAARVNQLLHRYHAPLIVGIRFMYGLRIVGPIAIGGAGVAPGRFAFFNALGAALWAPLIGGLGYLFGHALEVLIGDVERYEGWALAAIVMAAVVLPLVRGWFVRSRTGCKAKR